MLVMDAFSGDSVPVHLITREAFRDLLQPPEAERNPGGEHLEQVSRPGAGDGARRRTRFGKVAMVYDYTPPDDDFLCFSCSWTLIMDRATLAQHPELRDERRRAAARSGLSASGRTTSRTCTAF